MKAISNSTNSEILLEDEELNRLVKFFDVLIEMDFEDKRNNKRSEDNTNVLLDSTKNTPLAS